MKRQESAQGQQGTTRTRLARRRERARSGKETRAETPKAMRKAGWV